MDLSAKLAANLDDLTKLFEQRMGEYEDRLSKSTPAAYKAPDDINSLAKDRPVVVYITVLLRRITAISDINMDFSVQMTFRETWVDDRLKFDSCDGIHYVTLMNISRIWMPDIFFNNEKYGKVHTLVEPNYFLRIYPNGTVLFSVRISITIACPMNFRLFPLDRQRCLIEMASYAWTKEHLILRWKHQVEGFVEVSNKTHLPRFTLERTVPSYCKIVTNTGEYSCLRLDLRFKRELGYYIVEIVVPFYIIVSASWLSFWLEARDAASRVGLGATTFLAISSEIASLQYFLPPVSYTKIVDIFVEGCLTFVFVALLEFVLVNYASRSDADRERRDAEQAAYARDGDFIIMMPIDEQTPSLAPVVPPRRLPLLSRWLDSSQPRGNRMDVYCRFLFPIAFVLFNAGLWIDVMFESWSQDYKQDDGTDLQAAFEAFDL